jgi:hypothetical protein
VVYRCCCYCCDIHVSLLNVLTYNIHHIHNRYTATSKGSVVSDATATHSGTAHLTEKLTNHHNTLCTINIQLRPRAALSATRRPHTVTRHTLHTTRLPTRVWASRTCRGRRRSTTTRARRRLRTSAVSAGAFKRTR